jgi:hypothetical protein
VERAGLEPSTPAFRGRRKLIHGPTLGRSVDYNVGCYPHFPKATSAIVSRG